jgi:methionyl-tRNA formyltransferase
MRIALLCATRRGRLLLEKLHELRPDDELVVFSFKEESHEPPFLDGIRERTQAFDGHFIEARHIESRFAEAGFVDLMLVTSWRYMVPRSIYQQPKLGTFVFHDSLLPEYRGFAPTVWALINGEDHTGATLFKMTDQVDAGDIVDQRKVPIGTAETIAELLEKVTEAYLDLLEHNLNDLLSGTVTLTPQDPTLSTLTCKRLPEDNLIDWSRPSTAIYNLIRAVGPPYPGAYTFVKNRKLTIISASPVNPAFDYVGRVPGRVAEVRPGMGSVVLTGDGALLIREVCFEAEEPQCASQVLHSVSQTLRNDGPAHSI